jgi:hypothetical protein
MNDNDTKLLTAVKVAALEQQLEVLQEQEDLIKSKIEKLRKNL